MSPLVAKTVRCDRACPHFAEDYIPGATLTKCNLTGVRIRFTSAPIPSWCPEHHDDADGALARGRLMTCTSCGARFERPDPKRLDMLLPGGRARPDEWCDLCDHFLRDRSSKGVVIVENGGHRMLYTIGPEPTPGTPPRFLGHGGSLFRFRRLDGTEVASRNVWSAGAIPPWLWDRLPLNATMAPLPTAKAETP